MFSFMKIWKEQEEIINVPTIMPTVTLTSTEISKIYNINASAVTKARRSHRLKPVDMLVLFLIHRRKMLLHIFMILKM